MPDNDVWPPKPDLPDPLTEYDDVIAAKLAALSETKTEPNRFLLIKALRDEEGMELRQAYAFMTSYCDRHGVLISSRASRTLGLVPFALSLVMLASVGLSYHLDAARDEARRQHRPYAEVHAISHAMLLNALVPATVAVFMLISLILRLWKRRKK